MLSVHIDQDDIEQKFHEELRKHLDEIQNRTVFWDMKELCRQTCMSEPFVKEQFFFDQRFPKFRVGRKWVFPAKETEQFLVTWLKEQPTTYIK
ncbi:group-specific protein [Mesobacillus subterraneus]|uniref:group-specific protein n=1 Tax=Mesobacillus subterraneus TaxID=285983 RepID=UPI002041B9C8|nr:group-specific protein [Mesobacillus subterraneus]MCM3663481.1 group-specific protein [Mesobacillus subterraneus]MCM3683251.1 group-specific protein [Mesobacillus subterraneus]